MLQQTHLLELKGLQTPHRKGAGPGSGPLSLLRQAPRQPQTLLQRPASGDPPPHQWDLLFERRFIPLAADEPAEEPGRVGGEAPLGLQNLTACPPVLKVLAASAAVTVLLAGRPARRIVGYLQCWGHGFARRQLT